MKERIHRALDVAYALCIWVAGAAIVLMTIIIPWGIFTRYVLGTGSQWPEPISILLMVMFTFIGAAAGVRAGTHIAVEMLTDRMPPALQRYAEIVVDLFMTALAVFMIFWGGKLVMETMGQTVPELPALPVGITYLPIPIGGVLVLLFVLEQMFFGSQAHRPIVKYDATVEEGAH